MNRDKKQRVHTINSSDLDDENTGVFPIEEVGSTKVPCSFQGLFSAIGGGTIGYAFGAGRSLIMNRKLKGLHAAGIESGSTFALFGGVYAAVSCFCSRIRQRDDYWNGGMAGCVTGVAVAWKGGPVSALQSCIGLGVFSAIFDVMGKEPVAEATPLSIYNDSYSKTFSKKRRNRQRLRPIHPLLNEEMYPPWVPCRQCRPGFLFLRWL